MYCRSIIKNGLSINAHLLPFFNLKIMSVYRKNTNYGMNVILGHDHYIHTLMLGPVSLPCSVVLAQSRVYRSQRRNHQYTCPKKGSSFLRLPQRTLKISICSRLPLKATLPKLERLNSFPFVKSLVFWLRRMSVPKVLFKFCILDAVLTASPTIA